MASMASEVLTALRAKGAKSVASSQGSHPCASQRTVLFDTSRERLSRNCPTILRFVQMLQTGTMVRTVRRRPDERTVWGKQVALDFGGAGTNDIEGDEESDLTPRPRPRGHSTVRLCVSPPASPLTAGNMSKDRPGVTAGELGRVD
jgi:hypothetical protein